MLRTLLTTALRKAVEQGGYTFYEGFEYRLTERSLTLPAAWMLPPKMTCVNGRNEGTVTYRLTLYLMQRAKQHTEAEKNLVWDSMEQELLALLNRLLPEEGIFSIENIASSPAEFSLTRQNELSLKTECDVRLYFSQH